MECWVNDAPLYTLHIPLFKYQQSPETARNFKIFTAPNIWTWRKTSKMIESSVIAVFFPLKNLSFFSFSNFSLLSIFSHLNNSWSYEKFKRNTEELFFVRDLLFISELHYLNVSYLLLFEKKQLQSFEIQYEQHLL